MHSSSAWLCMENWYTFIIVTLPWVTSSVCLNYSTGLFAWRTDYLFLIILVPYLHLCTTPECCLGESGVRTLHHSIKYHKILRYIAISTENFKNGMISFFYKNCCKKCIYRGFLLKISTNFAKNRDILKLKPQSTTLKQPNTVNNTTNIVCITPNICNIKYFFGTFSKYRK